MVVEGVVFTYSMFVVTVSGLKPTGPYTTFQEEAVPISVQDSVTLLLEEPVDVKLEGFVQRGISITFTLSMLA